MSKWRFYSTDFPQKTSIDRDKGLEVLLMLMLGFSYQQVLINSMLLPYLHCALQDSTKSRGNEILVYYVHWQVELADKEPSLLS